MEDRQRLRDLAVSDTGFVFDPRGGATFSLNATGLAVLDGLKRGLGREELKAVLVERFDAEGADLHRDLDEFARLLREQRLVGEDFEIGADS